MPTDTAAPDTRPVELDIQGMTCASCAARIEKKLNKVDGVQASVNYATEKASVLAPSTTTPDDLIAVVEQAGYGASLPIPDAPSVDHVAHLRPRMWVAIAGAVPVIAVSMVPVLQFPGWQWAALAIATVVVFWAGFSFHRSALVNLRHGATTMDTLISMGTLAAYFWSLYALVFGEAGHIGMRHEFEFVLSRHDGTANIYFEAAVGIIAFLLIGRYIEARSKTEAGSALRALLELGAKDALVLRDGAEVRVPIEALAVGDEFIVRPGEKVAADGIITSGRSAVDASLLTGESLPVEVGPDDTVVGGAINTTGRLVVRATAVGADSQLAHIARLVEEAQTGKAAVQRLADKISGVFVPIVLVIALVTLVTWLLVGASTTFAFTAAVAVLIIACPCALGLATPTALLVGTGRGAQLGIVIRGPEILETARNIDTIVCDKTGTITSGDMSVAAVRPAPGVAEADLLALAGAVESASEHPIAQAIVAHAGAGDVSDFENLPGQGVRGRVAGRDVLAGTPVLLREHGVEVPTTDEPANPASVVWVAADGGLLGRIEVADTIKTTSRAAVAEFKRLGLTPIMASGDNQATASAVAAEVGISDARGGVLPADKVSLVSELQASGRRVAMVGDGVNDAAALTQADLGLAMGSGTDVAIAASDLTLMRGDLMLAADAIRLSRATLRTIKTNLFWAFAYNTAAIPLAALGYLNPMFAGAAMAFSSVFVVLNSLRLRSFKPLSQPASPEQSE